VVLIAANHAFVDVVATAVGRRRIGTDDAQELKKVSTKIFDIISEEMEHEHCNDEGSDERNSEDL
jgi:hypothetical protein